MNANMMIRERSMRYDVLLFRHMTLQTVGFRIDGAGDSMKRIFGFRRFGSMTIETLVLIKLDRGFQTLMGVMTCNAIEFSL